MKKGATETTKNPVQDQTRTSAIRERKRFCNNFLFLPFSLFSVSSSPLNHASIHTRSTIHFHHSFNFMLNLTMPKPKVKRQSGWCRMNQAYSCYLLSVGKLNSFQFILIRFTSTVAAERSSFALVPKLFFWRRAIRILAKILRFWIFCINGERHIPRWERVS